MRIFNYANFYKAFELGVVKPNMTKITQALFEPLVMREDVLNRNGNPYSIDSKMSKAWCDQAADIPENIKLAAARTDVIDSIGTYFYDEIIDELVAPQQDSQMYSSILKLINESDLHDDKKYELKTYFSNGEKEEFLGRAFLFAVVGDNLAQDDYDEIEPIESELREFKKKYAKPKPIEPPTEIEEHELGYVSALYRVYHEETGEDYVRPEDLASQPKYKRDFDRQRQDYYRAETIHRELRDTVHLSEADSFDTLKDEMYDGIINIRDDDYDSSFKRLSAVMNHATIVSLSNNMNSLTMDWVGPGEKKGVCHMLVNDGRLYWTEEKDDEQ